MKKILFILLIGILIGCSVEENSTSGAQTYNKEQKLENSSLNHIQYEVIRVIDGDTVELKNGERLIVRP